MNMLVVPINTGVLGAVLKHLAKRINELENAKKD